MQFNYNIGEGTVTGTFTLDEFPSVAEALAELGSSQAELVSQFPFEVFRMAVESFSTPGAVYDTAIWRDASGGLHGKCECADYEYRERWCKHLEIAMTHLPDRVFREGFLTPVGPPWGRTQYGPPWGRTQDVA